MFRSVNNSFSDSLIYLYDKSDISTLSTTLILFCSTFNGNVEIEKETIDRDEVAKIFKSVNKVKIKGTGPTLKLA